MAASNLGMRLRIGYDRMYTMTPVTQFQNAALAMPGCSIEALKPARAMVAAATAPMGINNTKRGMNNTK